jgi:hypothetical protein
MADPQTLAWIRFLLDPDLESNAPNPSQDEVQQVLVSIRDEALRAAARLRLGADSPHEAVLHHVQTTRWVHNQLSRVIAEWAYYDKFVPRRGSRGDQRVRYLHAELRTRRWNALPATDDPRERARLAREFEDEWRAERREMRLLAIQDFLEDAEALVKRCLLTPMSPRQMFDYVRTYLYEPRFGGGKPGAYVLILESRLSDDGERGAGLPDDVVVESLGLGDEASQTLPGSTDPARRGVGTADAMNGRLERALSPDNVSRLLDLYERWLSTPARQFTARQWFAGDTWLVHLHARFAEEAQIAPPIRLSVTDAAYAAVRQEHHDEMAKLIATWDEVAPRLRFPQHRDAMRRRVPVGARGLSHVAAPLSFGAVLVHEVNRKRQVKHGADLPADEKQAKKLRDDTQTNYVRALKEVWWDFVRSLHEDDLHLRLVAAHLLDTEFDNAREE